MYIYSFEFQPLNPKRENIQKKWKKMEKILNRHK